eukprot:scaffold420212_cov17-Prasinocladus_malaysianus.AAC.1
MQWTKLTVAQTTHNLALPVPVLCTCWVASPVRPGQVRGRSNRPLRLALVQLRTDHTPSRRLVESDGRNRADTVSVTKLRSYGTWRYSSCVHPASGTCTVYRKEHHTSRFSGQQSVRIPNTVLVVKNLILLRVRRETRRGTSLSGFLCLSLSTSSATAGMHNVPGMHNV